MVGIPLTMDLCGGSMLTVSQYQTWKVLHACGVFPAFVNIYFGYFSDHANLTRQQKEIASWSFLIAGIFGGFGRSILYLIPSVGGSGSYTELMQLNGSGAHLFNLQAEGKR